jgi:arginine utilization protein RocB
LHGLETRIRENYPEFIKVNGTRYTNGTWKPEVIRYADDFLILHRDLSVIQECKRLTEEWLKDMGLELKPSKTRIAHTLEKVEGIAGVAILLKKQKGKCPYCGLFFKTDDLLEIDHITPKSLGGKDEYKNWQILHRHCHDNKTSEDGSINTKDVRCL